jgi:ribosomal protein S18 acetylase RimI-like enzyme
LPISDIRIVEISLRDLKNLQALARRTFYESFAAVNSEQNMASYMESHFSDEKMTAEILNPNSNFFVALWEEATCGYLKINKGIAQTVLQNGKGLEIERIYIENAFKGRGIGKLFISKAVEVAKLSSANYLWLGVWEHNHQAVQFYEKNGFKPYDKHIFKLGDDEQTDLLMKLEIHQSAG